MVMIKSNAVMDEQFLGPNGWTTYDQARKFTTKRTANDFAKRHEVFDYELVPWLNPDETYQRHALPGVDIHT